MWVHGQSRRQGVATRLIDTVREKMVYGCPLRREQVKMWTEIAFLIFVIVALGEIGDGGRLGGGTA